MGLRTQVVVTLLFAFALSFPLLGLATVQLTQHTRQADRLANVRATSQVLALTLQRNRSSQRETFERLASRIIGLGGIQGVELIRGDLPPVVLGQCEAGTPIESDLGDGSAIRLWIDHLPPETTTPLRQMLLLYVSVTAGAVIILAFFFITHLIVRPVDELTRASERIASGKLEVAVPVRGGAELSRLAVAFNAMSSQLRADRSALEEQLEALQRTTHELESAQDQVIRSAKLDSVGRLSAGIAHEIGNPLAAILGMVELMRTQELEPSERNELLGRVQSETERIHQIIRDLLNFSRRDSLAPAAPVKATLRVENVIADAVRLIAPQRKLRDVEVRVTTGDALEPVQGVADQMTQVLLNLLLNAGDAMAGKGLIEIDARKSKEEDYIALTIRDHGPGIPVDVLDTIFEPFVTTKAPGQGTGLGLAVSSTIVKRAGGHIRVRNHPEGGAEFRVELKIAAAGSATEPS